MTGSGGEPSFAPAQRKGRNAPIAAVALGLAVERAGPAAGDHAVEMQRHALWAYGDHLWLDCRIARPRSFTAPSRRVVKTDWNRLPRMPEARRRRNLIGAGVFMQKRRQLWSPAWEGSQESRSRQVTRRYDRSRNSLRLSKSHRGQYLPLRDRRLPSGQIYLL
jgi:hypothetical protein